MRIKILRIIIFIFFAVILGSLFYYQIIQGKYYYRLSTQNRIRVIPLEGWRGKIYDRNGKVLADNRVSYNVTVIPQEIDDKKKLFTFLSKILKKSQKVIHRRFLARKVNPFSPVILSSDISKEVAIGLNENKYRFPGLIIQETYKRHYPQEKNSSHVLGYVGMTNKREMEKLKEYGYSPRSLIGKTGVEKYYDHYLKGKNGGRQIEVNSRGQQVRLLGLKKSIQGEDITLTVDSDLQEKAQDLLGDAIGSIVVMDPFTGEILVMVSSPGYDPNIFVTSGRARDVSKVLVNKSSPILNRAIKGAYPPGSVFKILVAIAGLDTKKITEHTLFECPGYYMLGQQKFRCTHVHGHQSLTDAIAHSCNVYFYNLGIILGADVIYDYALKFGLGEKTYIDLPFERSGNIPNRKKILKMKNRHWYAGDTVNMSIGQGDVLTTPLQLTRMMAVISQKGKMVQPHLLKGVGDKDVNTYDFIQEVKVDSKVFDGVLNGMRATVNNYSGTAHVLDLPGLEVSGKTGTAQSSKGKEHHAWFAGFVKGLKKDYAFCVFLEHGGSSQNANLVARQLLMYMQNKKVL